jgi:hypothetical protein
MVVKPFSQAIDAEKVFNLQNQQYSERLLMSGSVPAGQTALGKVNVSNLGHFFCMFVTGTFTTLAIPAGPIVDTGVNYLSGQLIDGAGQKKLFNDRIPLSLWLSPGRRRDATSTTVLTDPVGNNLFYPIELEYLFTANADIMLELYNSSAAINYYEICFHGIRIISDMVFKNRIMPAGGTRRISENLQRRG